jgi:molybdopterin synthase catalytic subunit
MTKSHDPSPARTPVISVRISETPIDPQSERAAVSVSRHCGGLVAFEGIVRDTNMGRTVSYMTYEAYEALAIKEITRIGREASARFGLDAVHVVHRIGRLEIGATAVVVTAVAGHRGEAFQGCRYVIDNLKVRAPLWKKEFYADGSHSWPRCSEHDHAACAAHSHG